MSESRLKVLHLSFAQHQIELRNNLAGLETLFVDARQVSEKRTRHTTVSVHEFTLPGIGTTVLHVHPRSNDLDVTYRLVANHQTLLSGVGRFEMVSEPEDRSTPSLPAPGESLSASRPATPWLSIGGLVLKLFKSAGVIKAALFGASYASFALLTDWRLGALLIAILVFHEYGHLRAMRSFGIRTKGMYLIPFVGGVAVGEKATTYWQEVYISMQGPVFGLYMTLLAWAGYAATGWELLGVLASFSALINLFNLLPIYPLDGGHVVKAAALSLSKKYSSVFLILFAGFGVACSFWSGLYLLAFFSVIGALDLLGSQKSMRDRAVVPMDSYGVLVSLAWLIATICAFLFVIYRLYVAEIPGANIPMLILRDR